MRLERIVPVLAVSVLFPSLAGAELKIGYIDSDEILANHKPFLDGEKEVQRYRMELEKEFTKRQNELEKMTETYERQSLLLSDKRKQEEQRAILQKQEELRRYLSEISAPQDGKLARKSQEVLAPIINRVNIVVQRVAKESGYDFVFNASTLAFASESFDLTQKVLDALQKELEAETTKQSDRPGRGKRSGLPGP